nr:MAG TPA: hypothetical protein [Bacteriophage sp.]
MLQYIIRGFSIHPNSSKTLTSQGFQVLVYCAPHYKLYKLTNVAPTTL